MSATPLPAMARDRRREHALERLFATPLLQALDARGRRELSQVASWRVLSAGALVFRRGEPGDEMFFLMRGSVSLQSEGADDKAVYPGSWLGEEALVGVPRRCSARTTAACTLVGLPVSLMRRLAARAGADAAIRRQEADIVAAIAYERLGHTTLGKVLSEDERHEWAASTLLRRLAPDEVLFRPGEPARASWLVIAGTVRLERPATATGPHTVEPDSLTRLAPGTLFGMTDLVATRPRADLAVADEPSVLLGIAAPTLLAALLGRPGAAKQQADEESRRPTLPAGATPRDGRYGVARSLLLIDQEACVHCGHCVDRCGARHGLPRLDREEILTTGDDGRRWLTPRACHHCVQPLCLVDCPTGAIERDSDGRVTIRASACTGCGACVKACPWDNIALAPSDAIASVRDSSPEFDAIAVKCDLCIGYESPACVDACPTDAIFRVNAAQDSVPRARPNALGPSAWGWRKTAAIACLSVGISCGAVWAHERGVWFPWQVHARVFGALSLASMFGAFGHAGLKRLATARLPRPAVALPWHMVLGAVALVTAVGHSGIRITWSAAGGAQLALFASVAMGVIGASFYRCLPPRYAALVSSADGARERDREAWIERLYEVLSGASREVKKAACEQLLPYAFSFGGGLRMLLSGRNVEAELGRVGTASPAYVRADATWQALTLLCVEIRAASARHISRQLLAAWLPLHIVASVVALVLAVVHVVTP